MAVRRQLVIPIVIYLCIISRALRKNESPLSFAAGRPFRLATRTRKASGYAVYDVRQTPTNRERDERHISALTIIVQGREGIYHLRLKSFGYGDARVVGLTVYSMVFIVKSTARNFNFVTED